MSLQNIINLSAAIILLNAFIACKENGSTDSVASIPVISTAAISAIAQTSVVSGGNIISDGGSAISARGICWSTGTTPTISDNKTSDGSGTGTFTSNLTGLTSNTTYYARAYAINSAGTGYGSTVTFTTLQDNSSTVTDFDGNVYNMVTIGTQVWMRENLKVTHYRNGDPIPNITNNTLWLSLTTGAYCNYNNDDNDSEVYGRLYNWHAVSDNRNIAPAGWHLPTDEEWTTLINYLGGDDTAGAKMKETGTSHWLSSNLGATNQSGFTALGAGEKDFMNGAFTNRLKSSRYWCSTQYDAADAWFRALFNYAIYCYHGNISKNAGLSVRLIKD